MKSLITDLLICPVCLPYEKRLDAKINEKMGEDIIDGSLTCHHCGTRYPIHEGTAVLLSPRQAEMSQSTARYETQALVSSYLWSHFGDLFGDKDSASAYHEWEKQVQGHSGISLDAGCAVGRFTFEMSAKCDFAIGIDMSHAFIQTARELMIQRELFFPLTMEGLLSEEKIIKLHELWLSDKCDFIVADAQALPFHSNLFSSMASLNVVDKVPTPLLHLKEMNRVGKGKEAQFIISDPFSWSTDVAREEDWLGGTEEGPFAGKALENIIALLEGKKGDLKPAWRIALTKKLWWKIRNHQNHFELIRSSLIKAVR